MAPPGRPAGLDSPSTDQSARSAALQGATLAFQSRRAEKPPPRAPKPTARPPQPRKQDSPASPAADRNTDRNADRNIRNMDRNRGQLPPPPAKSPSLIAATLAASRSASPTPGPGVSRPSPLPDHRPPGRKQSPGPNRTARPSVLPDSTPPPAASLITLFENKGDPKKRDQLPQRTPSPRAPSPRAVDPPLTVRRAATEVVSPEPRRLGRRPALPPPEPPPRRAPKPFVSGERPRPEVAPPDSSSDDSFVSASSVQSPPSSPSRGPGSPRPPALRSLSAHPHSGPPLPLDSLTSAIMAGHLASARHAHDNASTPPPPPPRRPGLHPQHTSGSTDNGRRRKGSSSPQRRDGAMLQTLRQPASHSDDEEARRRMQRLRKKALGGGGKKHAHREGARKRWRDEVSPRERRRYEAVWASNRGVFLESDSLVANVVVRDLWTRSRLPRDELAEVWDLVDRTGGGALGKHEFVVGMWLIDQRLRGRKIPARVGDSVWDSARGVRVRGH